MLDVYQVTGIVKQAQAEYREKFEKENSDIIEFVSKQIIDSAKNGDTETTIFFHDFLREKFKGEHDKWGLERETRLMNDFIKYLNIKGFYPEKCKLKSYYPSETEYETEFELKIKWPKN